MGTGTQRVHLGLALLAHAGSHGPPARSTSALLEHLSSWLARVDATRDHAIVWGPASFRVWWQASAPALVVFVARARDDEHAPLRIVLRGGSPVGVWDHNLEDLACLEQEPWVWAREADKLAPAICAGLLRQLELVRELTPDEALPGAGRTLLEFLAEHLERASEGLRVGVELVGHGLGGALASAVALWLRDTQGPGRGRSRELSWDPQRRIKLHCVSFASPALGNSDFATYIGERLGGGLELVHNSLDHAVHLWDAHAMSELPRLYEPHVEGPVLISAVINALRDELERHGVEYEQLPAQLLEGRLDTSLPASFVAQAEHQHMQAYAELLGLELDVTELLGRPSGTDDGPIAQ